MLSKLTFDLTAREKSAGSDPPSNFGKFVGALQVVDAHD